jgi:aerobic-type carbon monoxide dehydrogenase small subunit (CoxS/CutS family)
MKKLVELRVNGRAHELAIEPSALLLDVLRSQLQITGGNGNPLDPSRREASSVAGGAD